MVVMTAATSASALDGLEPGVYRAVLKEVAVETSRNPFYRPDDPEDNAPEMRTQFAWKWAIDQGEDVMEMPVIKSWTTASVHPSSNTAKFILPALGAPVPAPGEEYDTDDWLGKECQVQLAAYVRNDGTTGVKIGGYLAMPKTGKGPKKLF